VNIWNSLPHEVVEVDIINILKNRLHKYWTKQEVFMISMLEIYQFVSECLIVKMWA